MIVLGGHLSLDPSDLTAFMADARPVSDLARATSGNRAFGIAVEDAAAGRVLVFEAWDEEAAMHGHLARPETVALSTRWAARLTNEVRKYDATNERAPMEQVEPTVGRSALLPGQPEAFIVGRSFWALGRHRQGKLRRSGADHFHLRVLGA